MKFHLSLILLFLIPCCQYLVGATLYGYLVEGEYKTLINISPVVDAYKPVCDLSQYPILSSASSSADTKDNLLQFYYVDKDSTIHLVVVDPRSCKSYSQEIKGLSEGQDDVRDMKYNSANDLLYMVFPNPNCLHGSLDSLEKTTATVVKNLANVIDPVGLSQITGLSSKQQKYYFIGLPFPPVSSDYLVNVIDLLTGNATTKAMLNNGLDLGDMWGANYTLNVYDGTSAPVLIGAVSPPDATSKLCFPSGFYNVNPTTGNVTCVFGPINLSVYPMAELDSTNNYYYQIFTNKGEFFLYKYDILKKSVASQTPCSVCAKITALVYLD